MVRWVSTQVDRLPGWENPWVRLLHMSADLRCETRRLLGSPRRSPPAASILVVRVGVRRSERVAASMAAAEESASALEQGVDAVGDELSDGDGSCSSSSSKCVTAGTEACGSAVAEVREWKWGVVGA